MALRSVLIVALIALSSCAGDGAAPPSTGSQGAGAPTAVAGGGAFASSAGSGAAGEAGSRSVGAFAGATASQGGASGGPSTGGTATSGANASPADGAGEGGGGGSAEIPATLSPAVLAQLRKVADWQLPRAGTSKDWIHGALWTGIFATYQVTGDEKYLDAIERWAGPSFSLTGGAAARGDDQCAAQTFFDVWLLDRNPAKAVMLNGAKASFDAMLKETKRGRVEWWWEDALFMVPPGFARLGAALSDTRYFDKMNALYWDTHAFLWNEQAGLMYRDDDLRQSFWARGNGWVIAGAARVLQYLPANDPKRADFVQLLQKMSAALKAAQGDDGLWRANLLRPEQFPNPETSGSGFFVYALAWGINNGLLGRDEYLPVVVSGWAGLNAHVDDSGKLGYVQPVGVGPAAASAGSSVEYGVGAYLLAGSEVARLVP